MMRSLVFTLVLLWLSPVMGEDYTAVIGGTDSDPMPIANGIGGGAMNLDAAVTARLADGCLLVKFVCMDPNAEKLSASMAAGADAPVWDDDCVELFIAPCAANPASYYHIGVNALGTVYDAFFSAGQADTSFDGGIKTDCVIAPDRWTAELTIPLARLNRTPVDHTWRVNFGREGKYSGAGFGTWAPVEAGFHESEHFGTWELPALADDPLVASRNEALRVTLIEPECRRLGIVPSPERSAIELWRAAAAEQKAQPERRAAANRALARELRGAWDDFGLYAMPAAEKLRADAVPEARRESMALSAARGEEETASFAIVAPEDREVTAEVSVSLDVPFRFHAAGYVPITDLTRGGTRIPGMYPDPLLPVTGPVTVPAGESRQFFITVRPDGETAPGEYEGKVTVKTADAEKSLPVTLRVYDVTLPLRGRLKTIVTVEPWRFSGFMPGSEIEAVVSDMCAESMRQRLTPDWRLPWEEIFSGGALNAERLDAEIARRLELGATTFRIENWFFVTDANSDTAGRQIALQEYLASRPEAAKLFYLYIFDEPASGQIEEIRRGITEIRSRIPAARIIGTTQWRQLTGCVDWWSPVSNHMNNPDWLAFMLRRKVMGDEAWFYTCNNTSMSCEADNWKIDAPGVTHRALGWQLWRFGCTGYLYWHINAVGSPENSVWQDPDPMKGSNGDGFMFYPPRPGDDPCRVYPALRLFLTREGLDDYELMALLEDRIQAIAASGDPDHLLTQELRTRACELLNVDDVVRRTDDYDYAPEVYENRHREVLEILEKLQ